MLIEQMELINQMQLVVIEQIKETKDMKLLDLISQLLLFESGK